ncbi:MAG: tRNA pseudouridine(38-40) synthase TruA [Armatimonadota bacterium]
MRTLALTVAYDGTEWAGFQRQNRWPSIQGALEHALGEMLHHPVQLVAAGRTDAGVHAFGQVVSLQTENPIPLARIPWVANRQLPTSIRVRRAVERPAEFHARKSATYRRYWYVIEPTKSPDPIRGRFRWQVRSSLDITAMRSALLPLVGTHDFAAFCHGGGPPSGVTVRTVHHARVQTRQGCVIVDVQANAFLRQMIRLLVANLVKVGYGECPVSWLTELLQTGDRYQAGEGAPPCGLFFMRTGYYPTVDPRMGADRGELDNEELSG